jgi:hypothetical protein
MELEYVIFLFWWWWRRRIRSACKGPAPPIYPRRKKVLVKHSDLDSLHPGSILYLDRHVDFPFNPFCLFLFCCCGSQFCAAGPRIGNYFFMAGGNRSLGQGYQFGVIGFASVFGKKPFD